MSTQGDFEVTPHLGNAGRLYLSSEADLSDRTMASTSVARTTIPHYTTDLIPGMDLDGSPSDTACPSCLIPLMDVSAACLYCEEGEVITRYTDLFAPWGSDV